LTSVSEPDLLLPEAQLFMEQAGSTANVYLHEAIKSIDQAFDEDGYAKKHPELVGAFIRACALDFHAVVDSRRTTTWSTRVGDG
jgi:hypothetical protein